MRKGTPQLREVSRLVHGLLSQTEKTLRCTQAQSNKTKREKAEKGKGGEYASVQGELKTLRDQLKEKIKLLEVCIHAGTDLAAAGDADFSGARAETDGACADGTRPRSRLSGSKELATIATKLKVDVRSETSSPPQINSEPNSVEQSVRKMKRSKGEDPPTKSEKGDGRDCDALGAGATQGSGSKEALVDPALARNLRRLTRGQEIWQPEPSASDPAKSEEARFRKRDHTECESPSTDLPPPTPTDSLPEPSPSLSAVSASAIAAFVAADATAALPVVLAPAANLATTTTVTLSSVPHRAVDESREDQILFPAGNPAGSTPATDDTMLVDEEERAQMACAISTTFEAFKQRRPLDASSNDGGSREVGGGLLDDERTADFPKIATPDHADVHGDTNAQSAEKCSTEAERRLVDTNKQLSGELRSLHILWNSRKSLMLQQREEIKHTQMVALQAGNKYVLGMAQRKMQELSTKFHSCEQDFELSSQSMNEQVKSNARMLQQFTDGEGEQFLDHAFQDYRHHQLHTQHHQSHRQYHPQQHQHHQMQHQHHQMHHQQQTQQRPSPQMRRAEASSGNENWGHWPHGGAEYHEPYRISGVQTWPQEAPDRAFQREDQCHPQDATWLQEGRHGYGNQRLRPPGQQETVRFPTREFDVWYNKLMGRDRRTWSFIHEYTGATCEISRGGDEVKIMGEWQQVRTASCIIGYLLADRNWVDTDVVIHWAQRNDFSVSGGRHPGAFQGSRGQLEGCLQHGSSRKQIHSEQKRGAVSSPNENATRSLQRQEELYCAWDVAEEMQRFDADARKGSGHDLRCALALESPQAGHAQEAAQTHQPHARPAEAAEAGEAQRSPERDVEADTAQLETEGAQGTPREEAQAGSAHPEEAESGAHTSEAARQMALAKWWECYGWKRARRAKAPIHPIPSPHITSHPIPSHHITSHLGKESRSKSEGTS